MLNDDAVLLPVFIHVPEPVPDAFIQLDVGPVAAEIGPGELDAVLPGFIVHQLHIGEDIGRILADGNAVALGPELFRRLADGLDKAEFLHIPRRQRAVEVINQSYNGFSSHTAQRYKKKRHPRWNVSFNRL